MAERTNSTENLAPRLTVVLGPAGSGKTQWCLDRYAESEGKALLLVPSEPYGERLKARLRQTHPRVPADGVITFGKMVKEAARCPELSTVHRTCQRLTLASLVESELPAGGFFGRVREMAGFVDALGDSLRELKLSGISPEQLGASIDPVALRLEDAAFRDKASEIVRIYAAYQRFLAAHALCDEEDLPAHAAERIRQRSEEGMDWSNTPLVLVDGFFRLARTWRDVMAAVIVRGVKAAVTLPYEESRPLLFATPARTLESLTSEFNVDPVTLAPPAHSPASSLLQLERGIFRQSDETPRSLDPANSPIRIFDAPNPYAEAEMVIRAIRREHEDRATPFSRCAVIVRSTAEYGDLLRTVAESHEVPVVVEVGRSLAEHPFVKNLLVFCSIVLHDWRRDDVVAFLKSSYTPSSKIAADSLRLRASRRGIRQGRDSWRRLADEAREGNEPLADILAQMVEWDSRLCERRLSVEEYREILTACVTGLRLASPEDAEARLVLGRWNQTVGQVVAAARLADRGPMSFAEFHRSLAAAVRAAPCSAPGDSQAVRVLEPYDAGQLDSAFVAVMGLTERVFPRRINEDPFFRDEERHALREAGGIDLDRQSDRADDERLLFYMAATAARERLVLSFPRSAEESDTLPSFYLDEVRALFDHVPTVVRTLADVAPHVEECVNDRDRMLAECAEVLSTDAVPSDLSKPIIASRDRPRLPELPEALQAAYASSNRYSITEIEAYNRCPFRHLMRFGLKLRSRGDGAGPADKGTLLHAVMRSVMRNRREMAPDQASDPVRLEGDLTAELGACLRDRPIDASAHRKRMMERALKDSLRELARREVRYTGLFNTTPSYFELAFGQESSDGALDEEIADEESRDYDPASTPLPLNIPAADGGKPIQLCGAIDRVDLLPDGRRAIVLDYKLGSSVDWDRIKQGRSLQMPLYMMAVEQLWGKVPAAGCYESPRDRGRRRFYRKSEVDVRAFQPVAGVEDGKVAKPLSGEEYAEALEAAQKAVRSAVTQIRAGRVMPTPGEHCRWCEYPDICRMGRDGVHDGQPYADDGPDAGIPE